ncbi:MAG: hypothetical protein KM312_12845 [Hydrogenibacillus schlegelii]|uniref:BPL/LPL catalytic domain-containing protein n=1 Tax=Hydrogenibacillus schlegelii TaxID=1484 RepID=A0A947D3Q4_HYDSH|nr:hypothetical protein [Hydrogenibacillus schlegelii]
MNVGPFDREAAIRPKMRTDLRFFPWESKCYNSGMMVAKPMEEPQDRRPPGPDLLLPGAALAFAAERRLAERIAGGGPTAVFVWTAPPTFVFGAQDVKETAGRRAARQVLAEYRAAGLVRPSGGRLVPIDPGVVNLAWIGPTRGPLATIEGAFRWAAERLQDFFRRFGLSVAFGEVEGAFCPGRYDGAVFGKKIVGLAQRRWRGAAAVEAFVLVAGTGAERAERAAAFYRLAGGPVVRPERMGALAEWRDLKDEVGIRAAAAALLSAFVAGTDECVRAGTLSAVLGPDGVSALHPFVRALVAESRARLGLGGAEGGAGG